MHQVAVVTGAGSGVGRAIAVSLNNAGWKVALVGRRKETLDSSLGTVFPCDVADEKQVAAMAQAVKSQLGSPSVLVNSAGTNIPRRSLAELSTPDFEKLIDVNLNGAYYCIHEFLPMMRAAGGGTIVNIISDAGIQANAKAGGAYAASKFGLRGLTQAINAEERGNGIRACSLCPGDIDTPILDKRPNPPTAEARKKMLQSEDIARCVMLVIDLPDRAVIEEILIRPR
ncbi:MAG TPA: SDR family NAD(P)-dependent oxidoreductase [Tepidisphaeraceae bacterium]|jgi:NAD(P)-dependent dehydrogenase (short-subunit alcohol dehydrogenase family)